MKGSIFMKMIDILVIVGVLGVLNACANTDVASNTGVNRSQVQNDCATHYRSIADEFTRQGKIKACMRARGAL